MISRFPIFVSWAIPLLAVAYLLTANLAFLRESPRWAAAALAILLAGALAGIRGPNRLALRLVTGFAGAWVVFGVARGTLPAVPLLLPPILVPATLAWVFGRSLRKGRKPLVERLATAVHAPEPLPEGVASYTRAVTWSWTVLLSGMALANLWMAANLVPGGLLFAAGWRSPWPVTPANFAWASNLGSYLLIGGMFVVEFVVRIVRFPDDPFRNPLHFLRRARTRMPQMMEGFRRD